MFRQPVSRLLLFACLFAGSSVALEYVCGKGRSFLQGSVKVKGSIMFSKTRCVPFETDNSKCVWAFHCRASTNWKRVKDARVYVAGVRPSNAQPILTMVRCCRSKSVVKECQWYTRYVNNAGWLPFNGANIDGRGDKAVFRDFRVVNQTGKLNLTVEVCTKTTASTAGKEDKQGTDKTGQEDKEDDEEEEAEEKENEAADDNDATTDAATTEAKADLYIGRDNERLYLPEERNLASEVGDTLRPLETRRRRHLTFGNL